MTKQERFQRELDTLTEGIITGSKEWNEQYNWLVKKFEKEEKERKP